MIHTDFQPLWAQIEDPELKSVLHPGTAFDHPATS